MSKPVKDMIRQEIADRLDGVTDLAVVSVVGVSGVANNRLRGQLREKGIRVLVVKNSLARQALESQGIPQVRQLLDGPCAVAFGGESVVDVVRELLSHKRDVPQMVIKGAIMEGDLFGADRIEALSKYPTRIEALGRVASVAMSPGAKLVGAITGPGAILAGILKTIQEKQEEAGAPAEPAA